MFREVQKGNLWFLCKENFKKCIKRDVASAKTCEKVFKSFYKINENEEILESLPKLLNGKESSFSFVNCLIG